MASRSVYEGILKDSKKSKVCAACTRPLNNQEFKSFEKHVRGIYVKSHSVLIALKIHKIIDQDSDANYDELVEELPQWQEELDHLQKLRPVLANHDSLKVKEIPALQEQIKEQESLHPDISSEVEQVSPHCPSFRSILIPS